MFQFLRGRSAPDPVVVMHARIVEASRRPDLFGEDAVPDTTEGRFETLTLHAMLVLRRLRRLPPPADEVAQDLVDTVFAHLEIALREMGVGDFGVPKRMKKLGQAFYDRMSKYDPLLDAGEPEALAAAIAMRVEVDPARLARFAAAILAGEERLRDADLAAIIAGPPFGAPGGIPA